MEKKQERTAFNFYKSYFTSLNLLDDKEKLEFLMGLFNKQFFGIEPKLTQKTQMVYMTQKHSIDKQVEGWESKTKTKLASTEDPTEGGYVGGVEGSSQGGCEGKSKNLVLGSATTTKEPREGSIGDPYQQEQEQGKEQEKELVLELELEKIMKLKNIK